MAAGAAIIGAARGVGTAINVAGSIAMIWRMRGGDKYNKQVQKATRRTQEFERQQGGMMKTARRAAVVLGGLATVAGAMFTRRGIRQGERYQKQVATLAGQIHIAAGSQADWNESVRGSRELLDQMTGISMKYGVGVKRVNDALKQNFTSLMEVTGGNMERSKEFTAQMTALAKALGNTGQAGITMLRSLEKGQGRLRKDSNFNIALLSTMRSVTGKTQEEFNKMSRSARMEALEKVLAKLKPMMESTADQLSAARAASETALDTLAIYATEPLMDSLVEGHKTIRKMLIDTEGKLKPVGQAIKEISHSITSGVGKALSFAMEKVKALGELFMEVWQRIKESPALKSLKATVAALGETVGAMFGKGKGSLMPGSKFLTRLAEGIVTVADFLMTGFHKALKFLVPMVRSLVPIFKGLAQVVGTVLTPVFYVGKAVFDAVTTAAKRVWDTIDTYMRPAFVKLADAAQKVWRVIRITNQLYWKFIGSLTGSTGILDMWAGIIKGAAYQLLSFANTVQNIAIMMSHFINQIPGMNVGVPKRTPLDKPKGGKSEMDDLWAKIKDALGGSGKDPGDRPDGKSVQDFRYSRFEIQQAFAEGYDPDRIAVAFSQDLGRLGEQKLQSGMEPLFGVR